jgi:hypothetical protein
MTRYLTKDEPCEAEFLSLWDGSVDSLDVVLCFKVKLVREKSFECLLAVELARDLYTKRFRLFECSQFS